MSEQEVQALCKRASEQSRCAFYQQLDERFYVHAYVPECFSAVDAKQTDEKSAPGTFVSAPMGDKGYLFTCILNNAINPATVKDLPFFTVHIDVVGETARAKFTKNKRYSVIAEINNSGVKCALLTQTKEHSLRPICCELVPVDDKRSHLVFAFTIVAN